MKGNKNMTTATTPREIEQLIFAMLSENTGQHFLDSGGAYGRAWQRNKAKGLEGMKAEPVAFIDAEYGGATKSLFWHLVEHLEPAPELNAKFDKFAESNPEAGWYELMDLWLDAIGVALDDGEFYGNGRWNFNTYNFEHWLCDGTLQGAFFGIDGDDYLIMQIHGGTDVRGGYTRPKVFALNYEGKDGFIFDGERADFLCSSCKQQLSISPNGIELFDRDGNDTGKQLDYETKACPCGGAWIA
jgi:hypothetical protein